MIASEHPIIDMKKNKQGTFVESTAGSTPNYPRRWIAGTLAASALLFTVYSGGNAVVHAVKGEKKQEQTTPIVSSGEVTDYASFGTSFVAQSALENSGITPTTERIVLVQKAIEDKSPDLRDGMAEKGDIVNMPDMEKVLNH